MHNGRVHDDEASTEGARQAEDGCIATSWPSEKGEQEGTCDTMPVGDPDGDAGDVQVDAEVNRDAMSIANAALCHASWDALRRARRTVS